MRHAWFYTWNTWFLTLRGRLLCYDTIELRDCCDKVRTVLCEDTLWTYGLGDSYVIRRVAGYERLKHATWGFFVTIGISLVKLNIHFFLFYVHTIWVTLICCIETFDIFMNSKQHRYIFIKRKRGSKNNWVWILLFYALLKMLIFLI